MHWRALACVHVRGVGVSMVSAVPAPCMRRGVRAFERLASSRPLWPGVVRAAGDWQRTAVGQPGQPIAPGGANKALPGGPAPCWSPLGTPSGSPAVRLQGARMATRRLGRSASAQAGSQQARSNFPLQILQIFEPCAGERTNSGNRRALYSSCPA